MTLLMDVYPREVWTSTHGRAHAYHAPHPVYLGFAACHRRVVLNAEAGMPVAKVEDHMLCQRPACKKARSNA